MLARLEAQILLRSPLAPLTKGGNQANRGLKAEWPGVYPESPPTYKRGNQANRVIMNNCCTHESNKLGSQSIRGIRVDDEATR